MFAKKYLIYLQNRQTKKVWASNKKEARKRFPQARSIFRITQ